MIGCESRNRLSWLNEPPRIMPERACIVPAKRMQIKPTARAFKKLLAWMLVLIASTSSFAADPEVDQPNILLIVADDLGFSDLGCFGGEIQTPNLDQLASGGLRLTQFYTTGRCCPSRASLLSGQYPHAVGLGHMTKDIGRPGYRGRIAGDAQTIATRLRGLGYRSFLSGKWHLGTDDPTQHGFEEFYGTLVSAKTFWDRNHFLRLPADRQRRKYTKNGFLRDRRAGRSRFGIFESCQRNTDQALVSVSRFQCAALSASSSPGNDRQICRTLPRGLGRLADRASRKNEGARNHTAGNSFDAAKQTLRLGRIQRCRQSRLGFTCQRSTS